MPAHRHRDPPEPPAERRPGDAGAPSPHRRRVIVAALAAMAGAAGTACRDAAVASPPPAQWTELEAADLDGRPQRLGADPQRLRIVHVWARWCAPCRRELPALQRLAARLEPVRFDVVALALEDDRFALREYLTDRRLSTLRVLLRPAQPASPAFRVLPQTWVVAPGGGVLARIEGERDWDADAPRRFLLALAEGRFGS